MNVVGEFFKHNTMMNRRLLEACRELKPEQLAETAAGTYGSIGATLVHIANAQVSYSSRFLGLERSEPLPEDPFAGFDALSERFDLGDARLEEAASKAGEDHQVQVTGDDPPGTWRMPAGLLFVQAVNHGTDHRSQIATILTNLGIQPPEMDGWTFFDLSGQLIPV
jgi:uncharacterized damage-inducible protein DinB